MSTLASIPQPPSGLSAEAYLAIEAQSPTRHEYINGVLYAMSGASKAHNIICLNLATGLRFHLKGGTCQTYMSDVKCHVEMTNTFFYPDLMVVCDEPEDADSHICTSPTLIIEVLSPSTDALDWRQKMEHYRRLESLKEYVLVDQRAESVTVFERREDEEAWQIRLYGEEDDVRMNTVDITLSVADIYEGVVFPKGEPAVDPAQEELGERLTEHALAEGKGKNPG